MLPHIRNVYDAYYLFIPILTFEIRRELAPVSKAVSFSPPSSLKAVPTIF